MTEVIVQEGSKVGRYVLVKLIGQGGVGQVWKAYDPVIERDVAVKVLLPKHAADEQYRRRFLREPQLAGNLKHAHIVVVYDAGQENGVPYLAMEWIDGTDLSSVLRAGPFAARRAVRILGQIALALDAAHRKGLVHRDVKPSNILVSKSKPEVAHLIDFGIGKRIEATTDSDNTDGVIGTLQYVAPERLNAALNGGDDRPHAGVDIYSLACVMYETLTGSMAFPVGNIADGAGNRRLPKASEVNPDLPEGCNGVLQRGFATDPHARFATASDLIDAVEDVLNRHDQRNQQRRSSSPRPDATRRSVDAGKAADAAQPRPATSHPKKPQSNPRTQKMPSGPPAPRHSHGGRWATAVIVVAAGAAWFLWPVGHGSTAASPPTSTNISVGAAPHGIAVDRAGKLALVAENGSDAVGVVDLASSAVLATIPVGDQPEAVALAADDSTAYVPNRGTDALSVIDTTTRTVVASIPVGDGPVDVALSPDGRRAYVSNADGGSVSIVDTATRTVVDEVNVVPFWGDALGGIAVSPDGSHVLVSATRSWLEDRVFEIDAAKGRVVGSIRTGDAPQGISFSQDGRFAYVANSDSGTMSVIDVANRAEVTAVPVDGEPQNVVISSDGRSAYVMSPRSNTITVIDLSTNVEARSVSVDGGPVDLVPTDKGQAYVVGQDSGDLTTRSLNG